MCHIHYDPQYLKKMSHLRNDTSVFENTYFPLFTYKFCNSKQYSFYYIVSKSTFEILAGIPGKFYLFNIQCRHFQKAHSLKNQYKWCLGEPDNLVLSGLWVLQSIGYIKKSKNNNRR